MLKHSAPLVTPVRNNKSSKKVYFRLPDDVKSARLQGKDPRGGLPIKSDGGSEC